MANFFKVSAAWMKACGYAEESKTFEIISTRDFGSRGKFYTVIHNGREWEVWDIRGELVEPESTSPVEVANEYTAIKVAESVTDQSGEITHADLFVLLNQNRIHSFGDMAHINEMIDNTRIESDHLTVIYIKNVPVSSDHDKDEMNSLKDSLANRLDNNVMTGRKFTRSLWTDRQIDSEFLSVDQFAKMVAATQEAPQGWESVEGGAKLTWGESESVTVSPEFERDAYNHHVTTRLFDQLATRSHMLTRDQSTNHWKAITDMLWTLHASTIETRKMNDFAAITRASHGPMVEAQIRTCTDTLAALLATWHAMPNE